MVGVWAVVFFSLVFHPLVLKNGSSALSRYSVLNTLILIFVRIIAQSILLVKTID